MGLRQDDWGRTIRLMAVGGRNIWGLDRLAAYGGALVGDLN